MSTRPTTATAERPEAQELSPVELGAWCGLLRVHTALSKQLDAALIDAHGLPLGSYQVLTQLHQAPDRRLRMAELADRALLSRSGMTRLVDRLEREGLLRRVVCEQDLRGCYAELTDEGALLVTSARPTHLEAVRRRFLAHFTEDELAQLAAAWERVLPGASM